MIDVDGEFFNTDICIQFSLLQRILFKLAQKEKQLQSKIDYLDSKLNNKDETLKVIQEKLDIPRTEFPEYVEPIEINTDFEKFTVQNENQDFQNNENQNFSLNPQNINLDNNNQNFNQGTNQNFNQGTNQNFNQGNNQNFNQGTNQNFNQGTNQNFNQGTNQTFNQGSNNSNQNNNMLNNILFRVQQNERNIVELKKLLNKSQNKRDSNVSNNYVVDTSATDELRKKLIDLEKDVENIKVKVQDFNIYDMFKDSGDGSLDASKILISALENKVFKKFELEDEKMKKTDEGVFKNKQDIQNLVNSVNSTRLMNENMKNILEENEQKMNDKLNKLLKEINEKTGSQIQIETIKKPEIEYEKSGLSDDQIKDLMENLKKEIMEDINKLITSNNKKFENSLNEDSPVIQELQKKIQDLEKLLKIQLGTINANQINTTFDKIDNELKSKIGKEDIKEFLDKVRFLEEIAKDNEYKFDSQNDQNEKFKGEFSSLIKKLENLNGQVNLIMTNLQNDALSNKKNSPLIDTSLLVNNIRFNENNKAINQKFEQIKLYIDDMQRNIDDILQKLQRTPNDDDFNQYKNTLKSMIEEVKLYCQKRFADKIEIHKQIRLLDTQLKSITDTFNRKDNENWLLAKKPLNNFQCAACESYLKNINNKSAEYVPWNKYPQRDDKNYRMGHGFSRMLQMVNADILKTAEANRENLKNYNSDDEKSDNRDISSKMQKRKKPNNTSTLTIDANNVYDNNIYNYTNGNEDSGYQPHVVKIVKKNKNNSQDNNDGKENLIEVSNDLNKGDN